MTELMACFLFVCLCWLLFYQALTKSPTQDKKLPTYLKDLSISTGKVKHEVSSFPGSLGAIVNILDLLSTVTTQVNSEMMMVSLFRPYRSFGSHLFIPWDLWSRNITPPHCSSFFVFLRAVLWILGSHSMPCALSSMVFRDTGSDSSIHLGNLKRFLQRISILVSSLKQNEFLPALEKTRN